MENFLFVDANGDYTEDLHTSRVVTKSCVVGLAVGDLVKYSTNIVDGIEKVSDNSDPDSVIGFVLEKVEPTKALILLKGSVAGFTGLIKTQKVYLSLTGTFTVDIPEQGHVHVLGHAIDATSINFDPTNTKIMRHYTPPVLVAPWYATPLEAVADDNVTINLSSTDDGTYDSRVQGVDDSWMSVSIDISDITNTSEWSFKFTDGSEPTPANAKLYAFSGGANKGEMDSVTNASEISISGMDYEDYDEVRIAFDPASHHIANFMLNAVVEVAEPPWYFDPLESADNATTTFYSTDDGASGGDSQYAMDSWLGLSIEMTDFNEGDEYTVSFDTESGATPAELVVYGYSSSTSESNEGIIFQSPEEISFVLDYETYGTRGFKFIKIAMRPTETAHIDYKFNVVLANGGSDQPPWYENELGAVSNPSTTYEGMMADGTYAGSEQPAPDLWYGMAFETLEMFDSEYTINFNDPVEYALYSNDGSENMKEDDSINASQIVIGSSFSSAVTARLAVRPVGGTSLDYNISYGASDSGEGGEGGSDGGGDVDTSIGGWYDDPTDAIANVNYVYGEFDDGSNEMLMQDMPMQWFGIAINTDNQMDDWEINTNPDTFDYIVYDDTGMEMDSGNDMNSIYIRNGDYNGAIAYIAIRPTYTSELSYTFQTMMTQF